ncbi:hypothetical protein KC851_02040 [Candidatus Kaiserbacteria bacterium]|nr:hypothetical protein [Candidatus Kaiserbacteria bacterium]
MMLYNPQDFPNYVKTAGKITMLTALAGMLVFVFAFVFDFGAKELSKVSANSGNATTTLTVLNTPPSFTVNPYEVTESSTSTPTNSEDVISWSAIGTDSNSAPYFLLICSTNASPTANSGAGDGSAPPECGPGAIQWGVSASTTSGTTATVSTTTEEWGTGQFLQVAEWYAWVCDDDASYPACNAIPQQGYSATNSSPFVINNRPVFTANLINNGPVFPGDELVFNSTSSDPDGFGVVEDTLTLIVCSTNSFNSVTDTCNGTEISSTTGSYTDNVGATSTIDIPTKDQSYAAYGFLIDEHGHEALNNSLQADFEVANVLPTVTNSSIVLNGGGLISLSNPGGESTSTLDFTITDNNSCENDLSGDEIVGFSVSIFAGTTTDGTAICDEAGEYDANDCYTSEIGTSMWNLSCTATTTCTTPATQTDIEYTCEFPLWYIADPTDIGAFGKESPRQNDVWFAAVAGVDDSLATGTLSTTTSPVELAQFPYIDVAADAIAYAPTAPGSNTGGTNATSTTLSLGNTGLDQEIVGDDMCGTYTFASKCTPSKLATIPADQQKYSVGSFIYTSGGTQLSSTTPAHVDIDVLKTTSTSSPAEKDTYWGIAVPGTINVSGSYTGVNTFTAIVAQAGTWY